MLLTIQFTSKDAEERFDDCLFLCVCVYIPLFFF